MEEEIKKDPNAQNVETNRNLAVSVPTLQFELDKSKSFNDQAKDMVGAMATAAAIEDKKLVKDVTEAKKDELVSKAEADAKAEKAKNKDAEKKLQESTFGIYEGVASYIGLKRALPEGMLKGLMFIMQPVLGVCIFIIGLPIGILAIIMDGINVLADKFAAISENAKRIVKSIWWIAVIIIALMVINVLLQKYLNFSIW